MGMMAWAGRQTVNGQSDTQSQTCSETDRHATRGCCCCCPRSGWQDWRGIHRHRNASPINDMCTLSPCWDPWSRATADTTSNYTQCQCRHACTRTSLATASNTKGAPGCIILDQPLWPSHLKQCLLHLQKTDTTDRQIKRHVCKHN
jgi:hypothetical protein